MAKNTITTRDTEIIILFTSGGALRTKAANLPAGTAIRVDREMADLSGVTVLVAVPGVAAGSRGVIPRNAY